MSHVLATAASLLNPIIFSFVVAGGIIFMRGFAICADDGDDGDEK